MRSSHSGIFPIAALGMALLALPLPALACNVRLGYPDRERAPYYLGNGSAVPARPGAAVDAMTEALASAGCSATLVRLPTARLKVALSEGLVDMAPVDLAPGGAPYSALPLTPQGLPDTRRALRTSAVAFVRSSDRQAAERDPRQYFRSHRLAVNQGSTLVEALREDGLQVDAGSGDTFNNLDKVMLRRADGFSFAIANEKAMDAVVAARYGTALVRLKEPLRVAHVWLSASHDFHRSHPAQSEAVWNWFGQKGSTRLGELVAQYLH